MFGMQLLACYYSLGPFVTMTLPSNLLVESRSLTRIFFDWEDCIFSLRCSSSKAHSMDVSVLPDVEHLDDWSGTGGVERSHWVPPWIREDSLTQFETVWHSLTQFHLASTFSWHVKAVIRCQMMYQIRPGGGSLEVPQDRRPAHKASTKSRQRSLLDWKILEDTGRYWKSLQSFANHWSFVIFVISLLVSSFFS